MHKHNETQGRELVDAYLRATGKAITENVRHYNGEKEKGRRAGRTEHDLVAHRVNDSGGDEFLLYLPMNHTTANLRTAQRITRRILQAVYQAQMKIAESVYRRS